MHSKFNSIKINKDRSKVLCRAFGLFFMHMGVQRKYCIEIEDKTACKGMIMVVK